jgi:chromatin assembly factor 1 subunit A
MDPPRIPLNIMKNAVNANGSLNLSAKTVKPFFTTAADVLKTSSSTTPHSTLLSSQAHPPPSKPAKDSKPKKLLSSEDLPAFCAAVEGSDLSKVGLIEVLKKKFPGRPGAAIKATLETVAKRVGAKEVDKRWRLLDDGGQIPAGQTPESFPDDVIMLG